MALGIYSFLCFLLFSLYKFAVPFMLALISLTLPFGLVIALVVAYACVAVYLVRNKIGIGRFFKPIENLISAIPRKK